MCCQDNPAHFALEFPSWAFAEFEYLDSGTYSHVIKAIDIENGRTPVVFKIIKVLQRATLNRVCEVMFHVELYQDVFQEILVDTQSRQSSQTKENVEAFEAEIIKRLNDMVKVNEGLKNRLYYC